MQQTKSVVKHSVLEGLWGNRFQVMFVKLKYNPLIDNISRVNRSEVIQRFGSVVTFPVPFPIYADFLALIASKVRPMS